MQGKVALCGGQCQGENQYHEGGQPRGSPHYYLKAFVVGAPGAGQEGNLRPPSPPADPQQLVLAVGGCGGVVGELEQMAYWRPSVGERLMDVRRKGVQGGRKGAGRVRVVVVVLMTMTMMMMMMMMMMMPIEMEVKVVLPLPRSTSMVRHSNICGMKRE